MCHVVVADRGLIYAVLATGATTGSAVAGGVLAGGLCALIGIAISYHLKDVPASLLALGTMSSAVTGAVGGWLGSLFAYRVPELLGINPSMLRSRMQKLGINARDGAT